MAEHENKATRKQVFDAIDNERRWQDLRPLPHAREVKPIVAEVLSLESQLRRLSDDYDENASNDQVLNRLRQIAAICVRCMEHHGAPERVW